MRVAKRSARRIRRRSTHASRDFRWRAERASAIKTRPPGCGRQELPAGPCVNVIGIWRAETVSYLCQSGRVLNNFLKKIAVKIGAFALANGGYAFQPHSWYQCWARPETKAAAVFCPDRTGVKTRFQISRKRSQSHLPMPQSGAAGHILAPGRYRFPNRDRRGRYRPYGPEIILFTHPDDALFWQACYFLPDGMRFIIVAEYRHPKLVCRQFQFAGYKFPGPGNGLTLEIIPRKEKFPSISKKCMMPRCAAHVFPDHCAFPKPCRHFWQVVALV